MYFTSLFQIKKQYSKEVENNCTIMTQFNGFCFENPYLSNGEKSNLCFANAGTNALLSSQKITSSIKLADCEICDVFHSLINSDQHSIKSARPLKEFIAKFDCDYKTNKQQVWYFRA